MYVTRSSTICFTAASTSKSTIVTKPEPARSAT